MDFKEYQEQVLKNAKVLAESLQYHGFNVLTGGTDNHLVLLDLRNKDITGQELENRLANCHIITNKNAVPFDTEKKTITSGIRLGTPAVTSRGLKEDDMRTIANLISLCASPYYESNIGSIKAHVQELCEKYPLYPQEFCDKNSRGLRAKCKGVLDESIVTITEEEWRKIRDENR